MRFEYLEDVATADIAFRAEGNSLNELFENAAFALAETMADTSTLKDSIIRTIEVEEEDQEHLLFSFLSEMVYLRDVELLFFSKFEVNVEGNKLSAKLYGEKLNDNISLRNDVKAVTMHMLKIQKKDKYYATVVLDI
ncbi:archease [Candidatus Woesearchaeota archaeon]|nr:archease [Candidatus Woesearchaeota archaeon]